MLDLTGNIYWILLTPARLFFPLLLFFQSTVSNEINKSAIEIVSWGRWAEKRKFSFVHKRLCRKESWKRLHAQQRHVGTVQNAGPILFIFGLDTASCLHFRTISFICYVTSFEIIFPLHTHPLYFSTITVTNQLKKEINILNGAKSFLAIKLLDVGQTTKAEEEWNENYLEGKVFQWFASFSSHSSGKSFWAIVFQRNDDKT